ncbi:unnamed protein product [Gongylonema pulchrum]|uniref:Protein arginine N-methyltransferase n=1 Tax=Gongylonema pulchrum TaxID=637853 RepID=A0A183DX54_9BILA|nr:unnamed protein product [Gongylonema pulchrum]
MFLEVIDPSTGQQTWKVADENYDLVQEIARSAFGDMMHDTERNQKYERGLKSLKAKGEEVHVIDIGTGTGLLSMMAARAGAGRVTALEMFKPMSVCAEKVFHQNGYEDCIRLIASRSTDVIDEVSDEDKGNVIVAEVFDTELIGEGALRTFKEAHQTLAKPGCRVIPSAARIWVAPVQSDFLMRFHRPPSTSDLKAAATCLNCPGAAAVQDIQLSEIPPEKIRLLAEPFIAFSFDFEDGPSITYYETAFKTFEAQSSGTFEALIMWWDLDMDGTGRCMLTTAPKWLEEEAHWRDHWMQAVYYLPESVPVHQGQQIILQCSHDEFSFWFAAQQSAE